MQGIHQHTLRPTSALLTWQQSQAPHPPTTTTTPSHTGTSGGKPVHHLPLQLGPDTQHPPLVLGVEEVEHQSLRLAVPAEELSDSLRQLPVLRLIAAIAHETGKQIIGYH